MGVTIDNLQIEIQSSSTNAAQGIDALATSLEKLKKNGAFKTVSTNLDRLSDSLKSLPNVHQASNALRTLANSIEKLKGVGTISGLSSSLKKLPDALKSVSSIDLDKTEAQLNGLARAVSPLSAIKAGGLSTMVNAMKNLGKLDFSEITKNLEGDAINKFIEKVQLLNEKLGPLSEKMTTIKSAFGAINSNARSAASGVKEMGDGVNATTLNLSSFIEVARTAIDTVMNLVRTVAEFMHDAIQWDGIEYQFGNAFGEQADIYYEKITQITDALKINKQMFMENSAMAASMLIGFGVDRADAREMGLGYTELAYDIWAAYNNVYKTLDGADGAMAAVRSAIAGEVEPIRRAGFTIVESQLEQTAANHGLKISIESATEAQKSYLRYLELVDQAHTKGIVGTYASEMEKAEGMVRTLKQEWVSLTQAFASLFIPILVKVLPYITAFVDLLKEGVYWLAELLGVEIQAVDFSDYKKGAAEIENVADSAGGATDALNGATKAAKELKNATLGIDELNVISPPTATSGSGSGGSGGGAGGSGFEGLDVGSLWDETIFDTIQSDVDAIKEKMRGWLPVIAGVATALGGLRLAKLLKDINAIEKTALFTGKIKGFAGFVSAFTSLAKEGGIIAALAAAFPKLSNVVSKFVGNLGAFIALAKEHGVISTLAATFPKLSGAITALGSGSAAVGLGVVAAAIVAIGSAIYFVIENWDELKQAVKDFFAENIVPKLDEIKKQFEKIKEALGPVYDYVIKPIIDGIKWLVSDLSWLGTMFEWIGGLMLALPTASLMGLFNMAASAIEGVIQAISGFIQIVRGMVDLIVGIFTLDGQKISDAWNRIWSGVGDVISGVYKTTIGAIVEWVEGVIDWFTHLWDVLVGHSIVPDTINSIVEWFTSLPSKIFGSIENFVTGLVGKFKGLWENLKSWWNTKSPLKEYTPSIGSIKDKVSSAWTAAKTWWDSKKSALKSYTPSIGSIYDKLKERWDNARVWWNDKKTKAKEYTPSIGSIYEKLYDRWKNARDWWNNKKGSMSYTPSIGSITDKIKSAWNSAKSWWNKNVKLSTKLDVKVPKITVKWDTASAFGKSFKYPTGFSLKFAADGGIFDQGSMIWAGERGPEIVANAAGGKTGVMNVQQMQDAVYEGVYAAVTAAMRGTSGGGTQAVNVYLDGRQITSAVEQRQRERGASIMGNEVYSY